MILHLGERVACEQCIRGHRAADCGHLSKYLIEIKGRGRPGAKDPLLRFRIDPNPRVVNETMEEVESKNGRSKPGSQKRCFHLADDVRGRIFKVDLSNSFRVIGPATLEEIRDFESSSIYKENLAKRQNYKRCKRSGRFSDGRLCKTLLSSESHSTFRRRSTESIESNDWANNVISRNSSVFSLHSDMSNQSSDILNTENSSFSLLNSPVTHSIGPSSFESELNSKKAKKRSFVEDFEDDYKRFSEHNVSHQPSMEEIYRSFSFPTAGNQLSAAQSYSFEREHEERYSPSVNSPPSFGVTGLYHNTYNHESQEENNISTGDAKEENQNNVSNNLDITETHHSAKEALDPHVQHLMNSLLHQVGKLPPNIKSAKPDGTQYVPTYGDPSAGVFTETELTWCLEEFSSE